MRTRKILVSYLQSTLKAARLMILQKQPPLIRLKLTIKKSTLTCSMQLLQN
jgi:hypothetical protein